MSNSIMLPTQKNIRQNHSEEQKHSYSLLGIFPWNKRKILVCGLRLKNSWSAVSVTWQRKTLSTIKCESLELWSRMVFYNILTLTFIESSSSLWKEGTVSLSFVIYVGNKLHGNDSLNPFIKPSICLVAVVTSGQMPLPSSSTTLWWKWTFHPEGLLFSTQSCRRICNRDYHLKGWALRNVCGMNYCEWMNTWGTQKRFSSRTVSTLVLLFKSWSGFSVNRGQKMFC